MQVIDLLGKRATAAAALGVALLCPVPRISAQPASLSPADRAFIEQHFRQAKNHEASREWKAAAAAYRLILDKYPTALPRVYQNLGLVSYYQRDYDGAILVFERGLELDAGMPGSRLFLGICYMNTERPEQALKHLRIAHRRQPTPESARALGQAYMGRRQYREAIALFKETLTLPGVEKAELLFLIADSYLKLAERTVNEQARLHPRSKHTYLGAAKLFESRQGYQVAAIKYLEAAELDPMNAAIFFPLARMLAILGLDEASRLALERYWSLMPRVPKSPIAAAMLPKEQVAEIGTKVDFPGILGSLPAVDPERLPPLPMTTGDINEPLGKQLASDRTGQWQTAVDALAEGNFRQGLTALDAVPGGQPPWLADYLKVEAHIWLDDYRSAGARIDQSFVGRQAVEAVEMLRGEIYRQLSIEHFAELVERHPESCRAHLVKAQNLAAQEKAEAEGEFLAALEGCPSQTQIRVELADYYLWNSRFEDARAQCLEELKINPYSSAAKKRLGRIHVQLRDAEKGLAYLKQAAEADPEDPDIRTDMGRGYELESRWEEAVAEYQLALRLDPTLNRVHYVLARLYRQLGQRDRAREEFRLFKAGEDEDRRKRREQIQRLRQREAE